MAKKEYQKKKKTVREREVEIGRDDVLMRCMTRILKRIYDLEVPVELNFEDNEGAAAANNQGHGEGGCARAPQGCAAAANNQGHGDGGRAGAPQGHAAAANNQGRGGRGQARAP
jgi:hypothetical protein